VSYEFRDVVLIPFPFTSQAASKRRPAVIVSAGAYSRDRPDVVVMAVTRQLRSSAVIGELLMAEWTAAGLLRPSAVKPAFATLEQSLMVRHPGKFADTDKAASRHVIADLRR
jgi:mRNA interferase MazF